MKQKEFDKIKTIKGEIETQSEKTTNHMPKHPQSRVAIIAVPAIHSDNAQSMGSQCADYYGKVKHFREVCRNRKK